MGHTRGLARRWFVAVAMVLGLLLVLGGLRTLTAPAAAVNAAPIEVQTNGTGQGRVVSAPNGIDCPGTCQTTFPDTSPTPVTLTVTKTGTGMGTITSDLPGINCGNDCNEAYPVGTLVTLTAQPVGSAFTGWSGGGCSGTGTCSVTLSAATTVSASFLIAAYTLTITKTGNGVGTVTSNPTGIACGGTCADNWTYGTQLTLHGGPTAGSTFTGWSGGTCSGTADCTFTLTGDTTVNAGFALQTFALTVTPAGNGSGTVSSNPAGIACPSTCSANYANNTAVNLTAASAVGSTFTGWGGACSGTGACVVTMSQARSVTATFTLQKFGLTVIKFGNGSGTVSSADGLITNCTNTCFANYDFNTQVTLTATAGADSHFTGWTNAGCSTAPTCVVTMDIAKTVTANFDPNLNSAVTTGFRPASTTSTIVVTLTAIPAPGSHFAGWSGGTCSGTTPTCTLSFADDGSVSASAVTLVVATFNRDAQPGGGQHGPSDGGDHHRHHYGCKGVRGFEASNDSSCHHRHRHHHHRHHHHHHRWDWRY